MLLDKIDFLNNSEHENKIIYGFHLAKMNFINGNSFNKKLIEKIETNIINTLINKTNDMHEFDIRFIKRRNSANCSEFDYKYFEIIQHKDFSIKINFDPIDWYYLIEIYV